MGNFKNYYFSNYLCFKNFKKEKQKINTQILFMTINLQTNQNEGVINMEILLIIIITFNFDIGILYTTNN